VGMDSRQKIAGMTNGDSAGMTIGERREWRRGRPAGGEGKPAHDKGDARMTRRKCGSDEGNAGMPSPSCPQSSGGHPLRGDGHQADGFPPKDRRNDGGDRLGGFHQVSIVMPAVLRRASTAWGWTPGGWIPA
jgi:hypothetical protein